LIAGSAATSPSKLSTAATTSAPKRGAARHEIAAEITRNNGAAMAYGVRGR
jgi:hypothetical protein